MFLPMSSPSLETAQIPQFLSHLGETLRSLALSSPMCVLPICLEEKVCLSAGRITEAETAGQRARTSNSAKNQLPGGPATDEGLVLGQAQGVLSRWEDAWLPWQPHLQKGPSWGAMLQGSPPALIWNMGWDLRASRWREIARQR